MIRLTITDTNNTQTFRVLASPLTASPIIKETDVETVDGNISTYYSATKRQFTVHLGYLTSIEYATLRAFQTRQYENKLYPVITISGDPNLDATNVTAKMMLNDQNIVDNRGVVEDVIVTFRESKQMP